MSTKIAVLGGGAWGTALAAMAAKGGHESWLYARDAETVVAINKDRRNPRYLGDITLADGIRASTDAAAVVTGADAVLCCHPGASHAKRPVQTWNASSRRLHPSFFAQRDRAEYRAAHVGSGGGNFAGPSHCSPFPAQASPATWRAACRQP